MPQRQWRKFENVKLSSRKGLGLSHSYYWDKCLLFTEYGCVSDLPVEGHLNVLEPLRLNYKMLLQTFKETNIWFFKSLILGFASFGFSSDWFWLYPIHLVNIPVLFLQGQLEIRLSFLSVLLIFSVVLPFSLFS